MQKTLDPQVNSDRLNRSPTSTSPGKAGRHPHDTGTSDGNRIHLTEAVIAMYGLFGTTYLVNILVLPVLTRRIGPHALGVLSMAQAFGFAIAVLAEYGFNLYAAREVARLRDGGDNVRSFTSEINSAKVLLLAILVPTYCVCSAYTPGLREDHRLRYATILCIVGQAMSSIWLFQGMGKIKQFALLEMSCRAAGAVAVLVTVTKSSDAWLVQAWQGIAMLASVAISSYLTRRNLALRLDFLGALRQLRLGWTSFAYRVTGAVSGQLNPYVMGFVASGTEVGLFTISDKLVRLCINGLQPLSEAIYPFILRSPSATGNRRTVIAILALNTVSASICGALLYALAVPVTTLIGGGSFSASASSLRILVWSLPMMALNQTIVLYNVVRKGSALQFSLFAVAALGAQIPLCLTLAHRSGALGMAEALVWTQVVATTALAMVTSGRCFCFETTVETAV